MITTLHERSVHIDAPVEKVFEHVSDPRHFFESFDEEWRAHMAMGEVQRTPEGVVSSYRIVGRMFLLFHMEWVMTREEYVPNEQIVDHANVGGVWTFTVEPDGAGTKLTVAFGWSSKVPMVGRIMDLGWKGDADLDMVLTNLRKAIEA